MGRQRREKKLKDWLENCLKIGREKQHIDKDENCFTDIDTHFNIEDVNRILVNEGLSFENKIYDDTLYFDWNYYSDKPDITYEFIVVSNPYTLKAEIVFMHYEWEDDE